MLQGIDHVAVKVERIDKVREALEALGYACGGVRRYPEVGMDIAFMSGGSGKLELLEVCTPDSPAAASPPGIHHVGIACVDIEGAHARMSADDRYLVEGPVRNGAHSRIFFFRIKGEEHTLYECVETAPA